MIVIDKPRYAGEFEITLVNYTENRVYNSPCLDILYVLYGKVRIRSLQNHHVIVPGHFCVINPLELCYAYTDETCYALRFSVSEKLAGHRDSYIDCMSSDRRMPDEIYDNIRMELARIFQLYYRDAENNRFIIYSHVFRLLDILQKYFVVNGEIFRKHEGSLELLEKMLGYMQRNSQEKLTLSGMAEAFYLSTGHISRLFQKYLRTTFSDYLRELRTMNAYSLLRSGDRSVTQIAMETGFGSVNQMIEAFKRLYGETPGKIRSLTSEKKEQAVQVDKEILDTLLRYAHELPEAVPEIRPVERTVHRIDKPLDGKKYAPGFFKLICVGFAKDILYAPIQEQLRICQEQIGFEYIRFHGIFDEDMMVYREDENGNPVYYFNYLDMVYDYVLSLGFKLFVEFSYYPKALSSDPEPLFHRMSYPTGLPRSMDRWCELVKKTLRHCISRYGIREVRSWRFRAGEALNIYFRRMTFEEYLMFYTRTRQAVKEVDDKLIFGGLNLDFGQLNVNDQSDLDQYLARLSADGNLPDFYSFQCFHNEYTTDYEASGLSAKSHIVEPFSLSEDEDYLANNLRKVRRIIRRYDDRNKPVILDTWNATMWQRDLRNDTCFKSAFLFKNLLENASRINAFGYWVLSDLFEEVAATPQLFHGGYGLMTYNGIPKAAFNAFALIRRLGDRFVERGDGYYVTCSSDESVQVALYNYCHYDTLSRQHVFVDGNSYDRYAMYKNETSRVFDLLLDLPDGEYQVEKYSISRQPAHGSAYEAWLDMGAPEGISGEQLGYLQRGALPHYRRESCFSKGGLPLQEELEAHEVRVILIRKTRAE
ncbi:MAG: helix-turn-helix domain-containing protein [Lachnospiraceae bacterium]|nr:helix-turn-helix domain-containing protein [Lachnospiraceae bacterium]